MDKSVVCISLCLLLERHVIGQILVSHKDDVIITSSSQYQPPTDNFNTIYAIDGNTRTDAANCKCCGATENELNPWYKVDLLQEYVIQRIYVLGRTDYDHTIYKLEIQLGTTESDGTVLQGVDTSNTSINELDFTLTTPEAARYITLTLRDRKDIFVICELFVYAVCFRGKYGPGCVNSCGKCLNNEPCDGVTGERPCAPLDIRLHCVTTVLADIMVLPVKNVASVTTMMYASKVTVTVLMDALLVIKEQLVNENVILENMVWAVQRHAVNVRTTQLVIKLTVRVQRVQMDTFLLCAKSAETVDMVPSVIKTVVTVNTLMYVTTVMVTVLMGVRLDIKGPRVKKNVRMVLTD